MEEHDTNVIDASATFDRKKLEDEKRRLLEEENFFETKRKELEKRREQYLSLADDAEAKRLLVEVHDLIGPTNLRLEKIAREIDAIDERLRQMENI